MRGGEQQGVGEEGVERERRGKEVEWKARREGKWLGRR